MTARALTLALVAATTLAATAGCGADVAPAAGASLKGDWRLHTGTVDGEALSPSVEAPVTLTVDGAAVSGTSACNAYSGALTTDGDEVAFTGLGGTEMACEPALMALETAYLQALGRVTRAAADGAGLSMLGDGVELTFERIGEEPELPLVGTRWVLESVVGGGGSDGTVSSPVGSPAGIEFAADGRLTGDTGCNSLGSTWSTVDGRIETTDITVTEVGCDPDVTVQEKHVVGVLAGPFTATVTGDQLTLELADGSGLVYRASEPQPSTSPPVG